MKERAERFAPTGFSLCLGLLGSSLHPTSPDAFAQQSWGVAMGVAELVGPGSQRPLGRSPEPRPLCAEACHEALVPSAREKPAEWPIAIRLKAPLRLPPPTRRMHSACCLQHGGCVGQALVRSRAGDTLGALRQVA